MNAQISTEKYKNILVLGVRDSLNVLICFFFLFVFFFVESAKTLDAPLEFSFFIRFLALMM